jgi:hypothetical protein
MNQYTDQELDKKIHSFLSHKMDDYRDFNHEIEDGVQEKAASTDRLSARLLQAFTAVKTLTIN